MIELYDAEEVVFRDEVRAFLADWSDLDAYLAHGERWPHVLALFRALGERGWLALSWPREHGGLGLSPSYEYILWDEVAYARAARSPLATIVARTLLRCGSEPQRAAWLPRIRRGEISFALGYSEPEAGSDLASLRTSAQRRGDRYLVNGEKCWQSYAGNVDYLWLLARTGEAASRGAGLSLFIVDAKAPGLAISPLPTLDGDQLYECRFENVEVGEELRIGPEHGAWRLMSDALADERHIQFPAGRLRRDLDEVAAWLRASGRASDPVVRAAFAGLAVKALEAEALALHVALRVQAGESAVVEAAANKVFHTELCQEIARAAFEWGASESLLRGSRVQLLWLQSLWETIGGGTSEVMRGVVAKGALGLGGRG